MIILAKYSDTKPTVTYNVYVWPHGVQKLGPIVVIRVKKI